MEFVLGMAQTGAARAARTALIGLTQRYRLYNYSHASVKKVGTR